MKSLLILLCVLLSFPLFSQIEIEHTGIKFPPMTTAERDQLNAVNGTIIYNTETKTLDVFDGTFWRNIYPYTKENNCNDYIDNDGDGLVDCQDPDCDFCCDRVVWYTDEPGDTCRLIHCNPIDSTVHITIYDCDDRDACTYDYCLVSVENGWDSLYCVNQPIDCDDGNPCTIDKCDPKRGCYHVPVTCKEGIYCSTPIYCGTPVLGTTAGHANELDDYKSQNCGGFSINTNGPELAYYYSTAVEDMSVTVNLHIYDNVNTTLGLFVLMPGAIDVPCEGSQCHKWGETEVTFTANKDVDYWIIVDGPANQEGKFRLTLTCSPINN